MAELGGAEMTQTFTLPLKLVASCNAREHWRVVAKRAKEQRGFARAMADATRRSDGNLLLSTKFKVKITRVGKRKLDSDNLAISAKHVRDGIADALGVNDGDENAVAWAYAQEVGKDYGVKVTIEGAR